MRRCTLVALALVALALRSAVAMHGPESVSLIPNRGMQLFCFVKYDVDGMVPRQYFLRTDRVRLSNSDEEALQYYECFSSGRGRNRQGWVSMELNEDVSKDYRVEVRIRRNTTSNIYQLINKRNEQMVIDLVGKGNNIIEGTKTPITVELEPRSTRDVLVVHKVPLEPFATYHLKWRAAPLHYTQENGQKQISSNGMTLIIDTYANQTFFTMINDRLQDKDQATHVTFDVGVAPGTNQSNIDFGGKNFPLAFVVKPGEKSAFLNVAPKHIWEPWEFTFNYKWQSGSNPADIFGVDRED